MDQRCRLFLTYFARTGSFVVGYSLQSHPMFLEVGARPKLISLLAIMSARWNLFGPKVSNHLQQGRSRVMIHKEAARIDPM